MCAYSTTKILSINNILLGMDASEADDRGGEHVECEVGAVRLFVAHQKLAEAVEPGVRHFDDPAPSGMALAAAMLLGARTNVRRVAPGTDRAVGRRAAKGRIGAQVLPGIGADSRTRDHQRIEYRFELGDVMMIRRAHDDRQRDATGVDQQHALAPIFSPDPWGLARRILVPGAP